MHYLSEKEFLALQSHQGPDLSKNLTEAWADPRVLQQHSLAIPLDEIITRTSPFSCF